MKKFRPCFWDENKIEDCISESGARCQRTNNKGTVDLKWKTCPYGKDRIEEDESD